MVNRIYNSYIDRSYAILKLFVTLCYFGCSLLSVTILLMLCNYRIIIILRLYSSLTTIKV